MKQPVAVVLSLDQGNLPAGANAAAASLGKIGAAGQISARQTAAAMRQLPAQFTDIATQLAGGANPLLVLLQQGGQIKDSFGGIGNALRGVASAISPVALVLGPIAAVVGALGLAAFQGARDVTQLRDTLMLTGNAAGLTQDRLGALAERISAATGQTLGQTRQLLIELAATGQVGQSTLESVGTAVARIADLTGKTTAEVAGRFANQLREPARVAADLNRQYNFLDEATARRIRALQDEGRAAQAAVLTNDALVEALRGQREQLGYLESAWDRLTKGISSAWDALKRFGRDSTPLDAIEKGRKDLELLRGRLEREPLTGLGGAPNPGRAALEAAVQRAEFKMAALAERVRQENAAADAAAQRATQAGRIDDILTNRSAKAPREKTLAPLLDPAAVSAAQALAGTDVAKIEQLTTRLQGLFELQRETRGAPAVAQAIASVRAELDKLNDVLAPAVIQDTTEISKRRFLESEKAAYGEIDKFLADQAERAAHALDRITQRMQDNLQDALGDTFTRLFEGQFDSIGDLWKSLINRMLAEALAADFAAALFGKGGGGNVSGMFGNLFNLFGSIFGGGRATGGPISRGRIYEVNENGGPGELLNVGGRQFLLASQSGNVSPGGGGLQVSLQPSIHIDARSDQAQVAQIVSRAMAESQAAMYAQLRARGAI